MKRWIGLLLALLVIMSQSASAQQNGTPASNVEHIIFDLPPTAMCKKQISPSNTPVTVGPFCRQIKDPILYDDPSPVYQLSTRPPYRVTMISPMQDGGYVINNQTNEWFFQASDGNVYRQSLSGGPLTYITTPFTQVPQLKDSIMPCLNADQPETLIQRPSGVKAVDLRLNATGEYLTYLTHYGTYDDGCYIYEHHNLHRVNLATGNDVIINMPTANAYMMDYPSWFQTPSGYIMYTNRIGPSDIFIVNPHDNTRVEASAMQWWTALFFSPNGEELIFGTHKTIYRLHIATNVSTPIITLEGSIYALYPSKDPNWILAEMHAPSTFTRINLQTGEQTPSSVTRSYQREILYHNSTGFYYQDNSDLKRYDFAAQQITTVFTDTDPNLDYKYQVNHSGTAALISETKVDINKTACTQQFQYLNFNNTTPDIIYTHPDTLTCVEKSNTSDYSIYNETEMPMFTPNDRIIVFNEYMNTNPRTIRYHALILEQTPLWSTYVPTVLR